MIPPRHHVPRPRALTGRRTTIQLSLSPNENAARQRRLHDIELQVANLDNELRDTWGEMLSVEESFLYCDTIFVKVLLTDGEIVSIATFGAKFYDHPARSICAKILRFVKRKQTKVNRSFKGRPT